MANVIKHKRGTSDPSANDLVVGEVAIRTDVGKLFTKMDNGSVAEIAGGGSDIIINTLSSSSATGGGSATFNGSAYRFTLSQPPSVSAQQLLVSIAGVIQKPIAGSGQPSEGFSINGNDIILAAAPATGTDFFILTFKSLGVSEPADNSVTSAKIADGAIVNGDVSSTAAIAGTKIAPDFGSQNIVTTGTASSGDLTLTSTAPKITFTDSNNDPDFLIQNSNGAFVIFDATNSATRLTVNSDGHVDVTGNLDVGAGIDVTGNITVSGTVDGVDVAALNSTVSGLSNTTINNNADNRVITGSGTANTLNGESNLVFDGTNLGLGAVASGGAAIGQDKLDIRSGGIYLNSQSTATSGALSSKISFLKYHPSSTSTSYEQGRIEAYTENGYGAGGLDFYYGKSIGGGNYQATQGIRLNYQGNVGIGVIPTGNVYSGYNHLQVGESATLSSNDTQGDTNVTNLTNNVYLNSNASAWKRLHGDEASRYQQYNGIHNFAVAGADSADSTISFSNKLTIDTDGVKFNGDTAAANALDDYEEGTYVPTITNGFASGLTYSEQYGFYRKIGTLVEFNFFFLIENVSNDTDGSHMKVSLPFTSDNTTGKRGHGTITYTNFTSMYPDNHFPLLYIFSSKALCYGSGGTNFSCTNGANQANRYFIGGGVYHSAT